MYLYELVLSNPLFVGLFKGNIKCDQDWLLSLPHLLLQTNYDTTAPSRGHPCHQQHWPELNIYWGSLTLSIVVVLDPDLNEAKLFTSDILKLPKHIQTKLLKKHEENLKIASKHLEKLRRSHQLLTNSHLKTLKKLLNLNKVKFTDVTSSLRRQLPTPGGQWRIGFALNLIVSTLTQVICTMTWSRPAATWCRPSSSTVAPWFPPSSTTAWRSAGRWYPRWSRRGWSLFPRYWSTGAEWCRPCWGTGETWSTLSGPTPASCRSVIVDILFNYDISDLKPIREGPPVIWLYL